VLWFWIFVGPAILLALLSLRGERQRAEYVTGRMAELDEPQPLPPVSLIVTVNGAEPGLQETLRLLAAQDYPDFELIVAASFADCVPADRFPARLRSLCRVRKAGLRSCRPESARRGAVPRYSPSPHRAGCTLRSGCGPGSAAFGPGRGSEYRFSLVRARPAHVLVADAQRLERRHRRKTGIRPE